MLALDLARPGRDLKLLCLGAHSDDIEIGAGAAVLTWMASGARVDVLWCVLSAQGARAAEAQASAEDFLQNAASRDIALGAFRDSYLPYEGLAAKEWLELQRARMPAPDIVLTHRADDAHQDHRFVNELTWSLFRDSLILEYEIPKWDGDMGRCNAYIDITPDMLDGKLTLLERHFGSQRSKAWFDAETFRGLARLRGVECRSRYAEGFVAPKLVLR
jgi:LmbE family N-acetylglucosaminyl deacetylase